LIKTLFGVSAKQFMRDFYREISDDNVFNGAAALGFPVTARGRFPNIRQLESFCLVGQKTMPGSVTDF
jgi:hypothetical protein